MDFNIIYADDHKRIIRGIITDSQFNIPDISNQLGGVIKDYCDTKINEIVHGDLPFKIENDSGNLAGYFVIRVNGNNAALLQKQFRPAFVVFDIQISLLINNFIISGDFTNYMLF